MKIFVSFVCLILLCSCGENQKDKVIDMNDITPHSKHDYSDTMQMKPAKVLYDFDREVADKFGIQIMEIDSIAEPLFVDRFSPKRTNKLTLQLKENPITFCHWAFKDSTKTMNAFYNWIDCYGPNCKSIKFRQEVKFQKDNFIVLISDTSLTYISSPTKLKTEDWLGYYETKNKITDWKMLIEQKTNGKAKWNCVVDNEIKELNFSK